MEILSGKVNILIGDVRDKLRELPSDHFDCVVTSPPYWGLRDYGTATWEGGDFECDHSTARSRGDDIKIGDKQGTSKGSRPNTSKLCKCGAIRIDQQIGMEPTLGEHLSVMVDVFEEVRRVLKPTGTLWLNYGDCYATSPNGRKAADIVNDDRTFRDKPFSTVGPIFDPSYEKTRRAGKTQNMGNLSAQYGGRIMAGGHLKPKDLCMIPNRLAIALQDAGWWVRSEIIWHKPNPMPESIRDRPTSAHEKIWLMTKSERYFYDADAIKEPMSDVSLERLTQPNVLNQPGGPKDSGEGNRSHKRAINNQAERLIKHGKWKSRYDGWENYDKSLGANARNVWKIPTSAFPEAHFATFPEEIAERCIKAGCPTGGHVLDPFGGSGTTAMVAVSLGYKATLIELNPEYATLARARIEAAFMGKDEGQRHMVKQLGKIELDAGPLFAAKGNIDARDFT